MNSFIRSGLLTVLIASAAVGCGGGDEDSTKSATPAKVETPAEVTTTTTTTAPPPPIDIAAPPPLTATAANTAAPAVEVASKDALEVVTHAAQSFFIANDRAPKSLEELVSAGLLRKLPTPPEGKKYVYDPETVSLTLADK